MFDLEEAYDIEIEMNTVEAWNKLKNVGDIVEATRGLIAAKADMALPRIVITGLGGICGLGVDVPSIWQSLMAGRSAIGPITITPLHELKVRIGCRDQGDARYRASTTAAWWRWIASA